MHQTSPFSIVRKYVSTHRLNKLCRETPITKSYLSRKYVRYIYALLPCTHYIQTPERIFQNWECWVSISFLGCNFSRGKVDVREVAAWLVFNSTSERWRLPLQRESYEKNDYYCDSNLGNKSNFLFRECKALLSTELLNEFTLASAVAKNVTF